MAQRKFVWVFAALAMLVTPITWALQVIQVSETDNPVVKISMREITRIKVQNARIEKIRTREGLLAIEPDPQRNEAFIRPLTPVRNISMFVTTDAGQTFNLQLQPEDIPSTTIVLKAAPASNAAAFNAGVESYRSDIKARLVDMANDEVGDARVEEVNLPLGLWVGTKFVMTRRYEWDRYVGEVYALTNTSKEQLNMLEREFYQPGVVAVSVDRLHLATNDSTRVYVLKKREYQ